MSFGFASLVRAELYRIIRQRSNWLLPLVPLAGLVLLTALTATNYGLTDQQGKSTLELARTLTDTAALILAMTLGGPVLLLASRVAAHDYAYGTVRLMIGGGAGRAALLGAKIAAIAAMAAGSWVVMTAAGAAAAGVASPSLMAKFGSLPGTYWHELGLDMFSVGVSLVACMVLGTAASTASRSLAAGMTAALVWMPAENALTGVLAFLAGTTKADIFVKMSGWLLAPNLNHLIQALEPWRSTVEMGARPLGETPTNPAGPVGAPQCLVVIGAWCAAFLAASIAGSVLRQDICE